MAGVYVLMRVSVVGHGFIEQHRIFAIDFGSHPVVLLLGTEDPGPITTIDHSLHEGTDGEGAGEYAEGAGRVFVAQGLVGDHVGAQRSTHQDAQPETLLLCVAQILEGHLEGALVVAVVPEVTHTLLYTTQPHIT